MLNSVRLADPVKLVERDGAGRRPALAAILEAQIEQTPRLSDAITRRYFSVMETEPRWTRARSRQAP